MIGCVGGYGRFIMVDASHNLHAGDLAYAGSNTSGSAEQVYI